MHLITNNFSHPNGKPLSGKSVFISKQDPRIVYISMG